ncbi:hypothetical protein BB561_002986 [Smittium simulii]|uniref:TFIID subunit TAF5 NTD2 domain-containing protein n=1 Tax=Smittium simulii TaxID=133385 RepID=A0A2T9YNB9_9FUNG|nr:hypothetical protein BB561_002986 [Smittium simulii]
MDEDTLLNLEKKNKNKPLSSSQPTDLSQNKLKKAGKKHIDKLVLQYLRTKGYEEAEKIFAKEALAPSELSESTLSDDELEQNILINELEAEIEPDVFFNSSTNNTENKDDVVISKHDTTPLQVFESETKHDTAPLQVSESQTKHDTAPLQVSESETKHDTAPLQVFESETKHDTTPLQVSESITKHDTLQQTLASQKLSTNELIMLELKGLENAGNNVEHLYELFSNDENSRPCLYDSSFSKLLSWVDISLDHYKEELFVISYPIFVHCFLKLMATGASHKAISFLNKHKDFYTHNHEDQIKVLQNIKQSMHVSENDLAKQFNSARYSIKMTTSAIELLLLFLESNNLILIIDIINSHLNICIINTDDINRNGINFDIGLTGLGIDDISKLNQDYVYLGQIPLNPHLKTEVERVLKSDIQRVNSLSIKGNKIIDPQELLENFNNLNQADSEATNKINFPIPPLKGYDVVNQIEKLKDLSRRVKADPNNLPSVSMFTLHNTENSLTSATISENLQLMACGFSESYIKIWSVKKEPIGGFKSQFNLVTIEDEADLERIKNKSSDSHKLIGHSGSVYGLDFSTDNSFLISGSEDKTVRLWSTSTLSNLVCYRGHNYPVWDVAFSPIGVYFASASYDRTARLWSCEHIYPLRIFVGHLSDVNCVKFHPNSKYVITGSDDKTVRMWDIQTGKCVRLFTGHRGSITCISISPDGKFLASASSTPFVLNSKTKKSSDNKKNTNNFIKTDEIASSDTLKPKKRDPTDFNIGILIKVWDIGSGTCVFDFYGHTEPVTSLAFNNESTLLISGSLDTTVKIWNVSNIEPNLNQTNNFETVNTNDHGDKSDSLGITYNDKNQDITSDNTLDAETITDSPQNTIKDAAGAWKKKHVKSSKELLKTWNTVSSPIYSTKFSSRNLAVVIGAYVPSEKKVDL